MFTRLFDWLDERRRAAIYKTVVGLVPVLVLVGGITPDQADPVTDLLRGLLQAGAAVLALLHWRPGEFGRAFAGFRIAIYGAAGVAFPAAAGLGWIGADTASHWVDVAGAVLAVVASLVAVFTLEAETGFLEDLSDRASDLGDLDPSSAATGDGYVDELRDDEPRRAAP